MAEPQKPGKPGAISDSERGIEAAAKGTLGSGSGAGETPGLGGQVLTSEQRRQTEILEIFTEADPRGTGVSEAETFSAEHAERVGGRIEQTKTGAPPRSRPEPIQTKVGKLAHKHAEEIISESDLPRNLLGSKGERIQLYLLDDESQIGRPLRFPDRVDLQKRIVYEIKPRSPHGAQAGPPQAKNYARVLNEASGKVEVWKYRVSLYDPEKAIQVLSNKYALLQEEVEEFRAAAKLREERTRGVRQEPAKRTVGAETGREIGPEQRSTARTVSSEATDERATGSRMLSRSAEPEVAEQSVRAPRGPRGRGSRAPETAGYATLGMLLSTLVSALGALAVSEFVERYLQDLAEMPLPPLDPRDTLTYLADPATQAGVQLLDMLGRDWRAVGLAVHRASNQMFAQTASEQNRLLLADRRPLPERLDDLAALGEEVGGIVTELETIERNIDAILALEGQLENTAAHAEALESFVEKVLPAGIAAGVVPMHPEAAARVAQVLRHIKVGSRAVPVRVRALREVVAPLVSDWREGASELNSAYFRLAFEPAISEASQRGTTDRLTGRTSSTEDVRGIK